MRRRRTSILAFLISVALTSCAGTTDWPDPATPTLVKVVSQGGYVQFCSVPGTCPAPPTTSTTVWTLTPSVYTTSSGSQRPNRKARLVLTTPSFTDLEVTTGLQAGKPVTMQENVGEIAFPNQYLISTTDDGTTKTWYVTVMVNWCVTPVTYNFVNIGNDPGRPRSGGLNVALRLDPPLPGEGCYILHDYPHYAPSGGSYTGGSSTTSGKGAQCPPGQQAITSCEACSAHPGATKTYVESTICSTNWMDLRNISGYGPGGTKEPACTLTQGSCPN